MPIQQSPEQLANLLRELCKLPKEIEWVEFKHNNDDPKLIGEYISALANSAALLGKQAADVVWDVADADHGFPGIAFKPSTACHKQQKSVGWVS
ncbi:MAG: transcriptional regulator, partial [Methylomicrobium sp.]|nr:transcriptional regulator [Methylomicrobium sp.]